MSDTDPFISLDIERTATEPGFVGYQLAQLRREQNISPKQQAEALGIGLEALTTLCSSRMPKSRADVELIAARMGWEAERTAALLGLGGAT
jgi:hypothetical protein